MHRDLTAFDAAAILIVLASGLGYINHRWLRLPASVGMTLMGAIASLIVIAIDRITPSSTLGSQLAAFLGSIDFHRVLMEGMLSFLLFAGALHVDWAHMRKGRLPILVFSTVGVILSTIIVGFGFHWISAAFGSQVPLSWCLVFGALISPTDPVAVMAVMKRAAMPETLQATVAGESLFNDGVGVVVFTILLRIALGQEPFTLSGAAADFLREAGGGAALGFLIGWLAFRLMRTIDDYSIEVMISLAVVMGGYSLAMATHVSGPVAMAVAGLLTGNAGVAQAMSDTTRDYLLKFWGLIDEILNAVLFLLIGLEVIVVASSLPLLGAGAAAILLTLTARALSVGLPLKVMKRWMDMGPLAFPTLVWGGLRGGISIALALSLPESPVRSAILAATYLVVIFAVIVQGASISGLIAHLKSKADGAR
ncbi:cation:proton antiporter [Novosphingobium aquiterrae]|uniref:Cation:proton antiporter n=1 Tax=Novosphingobium aquiterrae TaxID=624388 RepID=A0ABV6PGJ7_9SPHN